MGNIGVTTVKSKKNDIETPYLYKNDRSNTKGHTTMITKLLTVAEIARILDVSKATAYRLAREMNYTRIGRRVLVTERALETYIQNHSKRTEKLEKQNTLLTNP